MPFCPKCGFEYRAGIEVCPDCDEKLVDALPDEPSDAEIDEAEVDWTPIARLTSKEYAEMVLESLRKKDIPAVIISGTGYFGQAGLLGPSSYAAVGGAYTIAVQAEFVGQADAEGELLLGEIWTKSRIEDDE